MTVNSESYVSSIRIGLDAVADYWTILILRELFIGATHWNEFEERLQIPPSTLNKRLKFLVDLGCLTKVKNRGERQSSYILTVMGKELFPFIIALREWQLTWDQRPEVFVTPWLHSCGVPLRCTGMCDCCDENIESGEIEFRDDATPEHVYIEPPPRHRRSSGPAARDPRARSNLLPKIVEVIGDRRTSLVMAALLRGETRFDPIQQYTGLAPATLSDRLKKLQLLDLAHSRLYQRKPDRFEYFPSEAGLALSQTSLYLLTWSNRWLRDYGAGATRAIHTKCGASINGQLVCVHCRGTVDIGQCRLDGTQFVEAV